MKFTIRITQLTRKFGCLVAYKTNGIQSLKKIRYKLYPSKMIKLSFKADMNVTTVIVHKNGQV